MVMIMKIELFVMFFCKLHDTYTSNFEEVQMHCIYMMELGRKLLRPPCETSSVVFDLEGIGFRNLDLKFTAFFISMLEKNYPESLGVAYVMNAPWIFWSTWPVIKALLPPNTSHKIKFLNKEQLINFIPKESLLQQYGGNDLFKWQFEEKKVE